MWRTPCIHRKTTLVIVAESTVAANDNVADTSWCSSCRRHHHTRSECRTSWSVLTTNYSSEYLDPLIVRQPFPSLELTFTHFSLLLAEETPRTHCQRLFWHTSSVIVGSIHSESFRGYLSKYVVNTRRPCIFLPRHFHLDVVDASFDFHSSSSPPPLQDSRRVESAAGIGTFALARNPTPAQICHLLRDGHAVHVCSDALLTVDKDDMPHFVDVFITMGDSEYGVASDICN